LACVAAAASPHDQYALYSEASAHSDAAILSTNDRVVKQVQVRLRGLGYDTGSITGFMGQKTQIAIQLFEVDHCHPVRPEITRRLLTWLGIRV
jgi:peptidoglycan hydrolase-like protein with peptidoglycan-binding domain